MRKVLAGRGPSLAAWATAACVLAGVTPGARAASWKDSSGEWSFNWDTTIGYAQGWRVSDQDCRLIASANGGCGYSPNIDNGNLNFPATATFSQAATGVTELAFNYKEKWGLFVRASGLYDFEVMDNNAERRIPLDHFAKDYVGSYVRLLDAFGFWRFDLGTMPSELRLGRQVVSWGESTFIPNGLNQVNHFDVANLRTPGSELKTALLPDDMVVFNTQLTKNVSTQLLYLFDWNETIVEANGSYFSTNDGGTPGGNKVFLGFGQISDLGVNFAPLGGPFISNFQAINRLPDHNPSNAGQFGVKFKVNFPTLNHGTEIGFYFLNYTSKVPVVSAQTGTQAGLANGFGAASAAGGAAQALAAGLPFNEAVAVGAAAGQQRATQLGGNLSATTATQYATIGANTLLAGGNVAAQAQSLGTNEYGQTAGYFEEFPQDIKLIGVSFNTQIQPTGTALQGELTYRHGIPFQYDDTELLVRRTHALRVGRRAVAGSAGERAGAVPAQRADPGDGLQPARGVRAQPDGHRLGAQGHVAGAGHRHADLRQRAQGLAAGGGVRGCGGLRPAAGEPVRGRSGGARSTPGRPGNEPERQPVHRQLPPVSRPGRVGCAVPDVLVLRLRGGGTPRVHQPHSVGEHPAARHLVAGSRRRFAWPGR